MRRLLLLSALAPMIAACGPASTEADLDARARAIHDAVITIDTHDDIEADFATPAMNPCDSTARQVDIPKMEKGGLDVAFFIVYVGQTARNDSSYAKAKADAMVKFNAIHRMAEQLCPDRIQIAYSPDDVVSIHDAGKRVAVIAIENGFVIGTDLSLLATYHDLGARYMTLAHQGHNDIADSANPRENLGDAESEHDGVSAFGEEVIAEMNRLGIMVDVSHISKAAMLDAVRLSRAPVVASHSAIRALADNPRNLDDEELLALKENGGVVQVVALGDYVRSGPPEKQAYMDSVFTALRNDPKAAAAMAGGQPSDSLMAVYRSFMAEVNRRWPGPGVEAFVDHVDYAVKLIGVDHVGISSDFDGGGGIEGWGNAAETLNVTRELVRRGYSEEDIRKIWGGNLLRVWGEVDRVAAELQNRG